MTASQRGERGLLIHGGALGDFVLTLRVIAALRTVTPRITVAARSELARSLVGTNGIAEFVDLETSGFHSLFAESAAWRRVPKFLKSTFSFAINMLPAEHVSGNLRRIGISKVIDLDPRPNDGDFRHISDQWLAALVPHGLNPNPSTSFIQPSRIELRHARKALRKLAHDDSKPIGLIHPGSGGKRKCWPLMMDLAHRIRDEGMNAVCLLGPVEIDTMPSDEQAAWADEFPIITSSVDGLAPLLSSADFVVGNDSGISHLAAAVGTHALAVFGPTDPRVWRPLGSRSAIVTPPDGEDWPSVESVLETLLAQGRSELEA